MGLDRRQAAVAAVQYGVAALALGWAVSQVDVAGATRFLRGVDAPTAAALIAVSVVGLLARFATWYAVMAPLQPTTLRAAVDVDLVVNFVNQLLPSRLTGRVAAPFVLRGRTGMAYADAAAATGVHTAVYALLYGCTAAAGVGLLAGRLSLGLVALLAASTALYLAAGLFVLAAGTNLRRADPLVAGVARIARRVPRVGPGVADRIAGLREGTGASTAAARSLAADPGVWARYAAGWTVALVVAPGVRVGLLLDSAGVAVDPLTLPLVVVAAYSVTLLPVTPGGVGVTEATATAVFVALGVPGSVAVPVILVDRTLGVYLPALAGWYPAARLDLSTLS